MQKKLVFKEIYKEVENLFPSLKPGERLHYKCREWIMPHHIDLVLNWTQKLAKKYKANEEVCFLGGLFHDTGLVYKRISNSPYGHENHSVEFAEIILNKYKFPNETIEKVLKCVRSTEATVEPTNMEEKIVRTADALSHFFSVHFMAKSFFYNNWEVFIEWLEEKIRNNEVKLCLKDEKKVAQPIIEYYKQSIAIYKQGLKGAWKDYY